MHLLPPVHWPWHIIGRGGEVGRGGRVGGEGLRLQHRPLEQLPGAELKSRGHVLPLTQVSLQVEGGGGRLRLQHRWPLEQEPDAVENALGHRSPLTHVSLQVEGGGGGGMFRLQHC